MDIRQLEYFISVADYLNFTQAAKHHYIAQTAMSQQIMAIEQQIGVKLFERTNRFVKLTPAGKAFYEEAQKIVSASKRAVLRAQKVSAGVDGLLRIGFQGPHEEKFLPQLLRAFRSQYPNIFVELHHHMVDDMRRALECGELDLVFNLDNPQYSSDNIEKRFIFRERLCALLPPGHKFENSTHLTRSDLADEEFVSISPNHDPYVMSAFVKDCVMSGFSPNIVAQCEHFSALVVMVKAGIGIAIFPRCFRALDPELAIIPLEGENEYIDLFVMWLKSNPNTCIQVFLDELDKFQIQSE